MNWDQIAGKWWRIRGDLRQKWGKLIDDDVEVIEGSRDKAVGMLRERYGIAKEESQRELDEWLKATLPTGPGSHRRGSHVKEERASQTK